VCRDTGEGNDTLFVVESGYFEAAENGDAEALVEIGTDCSQLGGKLRAQRESISVDSATR
jgi:hypothetical protein